MDTRDIKDSFDQLGLIMRRTATGISPHNVMK
jgi:hypothetical protein